jgi:nucleotide-binding universal stress UspA family protein
MKILLAVDGSKYSDAAVQALASKIRKEDADVLVLQVVEPRIFSTPPQMAAGYEPEMAEIMKEQFQNAQQTVDRAVAFGVAEARLLPAIMGNFKFLPSLALGLVAVVWIAGLELFLHFFDRYLSGN